MSHNTLFAPLITAETSWVSTSLCFRRVSEDYLVVEAVPRNQSPQAEFPANREKNREFGDLGGFRPKRPFQKIG